jgi:hypothetical protein
MSYQIKRSNKSIVVVQRWYVDGVQKEKHILTVEPFTTPARLHELQKEFRKSKGKLPKRTVKEKRDKIIRVSDTDLNVINDALESSRDKQILEDDKAEHATVSERIKSPTKTYSKQSERAAIMKYGSDTLKRKRGYIK